MKFATVSKSLVLALAVLLATSAFAGTKANLHLNDRTTVNGTTLKPGDYKLQWDGTGSVEVSILQGKNVVTKIPAKIVDLSSPAVSDAAVIIRNTDGSKSLSGARFQGKKFAVEVGEASGGYQAGSSQ